MNKKITILLTSLLIFFNACEDADINSENSSLKKYEKKELTPIKEEDKSNSTNDLLKSMGFDFNEKKISIDFNKTDNFFHKIEIEMHGKVEKIERKIKNSEINLTKDIGIEFTKDKIGIDLNKTRNMLQGINSLIKDIVLDINNSMN